MPRRCPQGERHWSLSGGAPARKLFLQSGLVLVAEDMARPAARALQVTSALHDAGWMMEIAELVSLANS